MKGNILNFTAESAVHAFRFAKIGTAEGKVKEATAGSVVVPDLEMTLTEK